MTIIIILHLNCLDNHNCSMHWASRHVNSGSIVSSSVAGRYSGIGYATSDFPTDRRDKPDLTALAVLGSWREAGQIKLTLIIGARELIPALARAKVLSITVRACET